MGEIFLDHILTGTACKGRWKSMQNSKVRMKARGMTCHACHIFCFVILAHYVHESETSSNATTSNSKSRVNNALRFLY